MNADTAAGQCWIEHQTLNHVKDALRVTLNWNVPSVGLPRKVSSVSFAMRSFQRHLIRLMDLEEEGGYMVIVGEAKPNMCCKADMLRSQHDQFRVRLEEIVPSIESLSPHDEAGLKEVCREITELLRRVDRHDASEVELIQEALLSDEGGEG